MLTVSMAAARRGVAGGADGPVSRAWLAYLALGLAGTAAYFLIPGKGFALVFQVGAYASVSASAAVAVWIGVRRYRPEPSLPWVLLGLSQAVYAAADAAYCLADDFFNALTTPSFVDALYLLHYPLVVAALTLFIRHRSPGRDLPSLLDAATLAVVAALLSWLFYIVPQAQAGESVVMRTVLLGYPVMDLAMLVVGLRLLLGAGRRPLSFFLLVGNLAAILTADTVYGLQSLAGSYEGGTVLDAVWLLGNLSLGAAALHPTMRELAGAGQGREPSVGGLRVVALSTVALVAPATLIVQYVRHDVSDLPVIAVACAALFALAIARMSGLVADHRRVANTDALTGLRTRRFVEEQLAAEVARAQRGGGSVALFIVDVDHFKAVNDRYGHPAGDVVLTEIAGRLRAATRSGELLARYGGEEFALLVPDVEPRELTAISERLRARVGGAPIAVGDDLSVSVTVSVGAAGYPVHTTHAAELVAIADRALYTAKVRGRDRTIVGDVRERLRVPIGIMRAQAPMVEYLQHVADEVDGWLSPDEHGRAVGRWAMRLAAELGFDEATCLRTELAGRLHDVGKIVVPRGILVKKEPLTDLEWLALREHPAHGERLVRALPGFGSVAKIILQHHEWYDGTGYPARLRRMEIRPEARLISVCDSWAAMRCDRPYRAAISEEAAREQLLLGRGGQFDPNVVDLFLDLHRRGSVGRLRRFRAADDPGLVGSATVGLS